MIKQVHGIKYPNGMAIICCECEEIMVKETNKLWEAYKNFELDLPNNLIFP